MESLAKTDTRMKFDARRLFRTERRCRLGDRTQVSPTAAVRLSGWNFKAPWSPTSIERVVAETDAVQAGKRQVTRIVVGNILDIQGV
jgi:hypothetical protein